MSQAQRPGRRGRQPPATAAAAAAAEPGRRPLRVLLVIAHPDDETMFFTPAIVDMQRRGCELFLLCCSTGGWANNLLGSVEMRMAR
jgi:hypothetical protein